MIEVGEPCDAARLAAAEEELGVPLPAPIRTVLLAGDGRFRTDGEWWVVWPIDRLVADNRAAWSAGELRRGLVAFGDDGTGNPFCVPVDGHEVVRWSWLDGDVEATIGSLDDFVQEWCH